MQATPMDIEEEEVESSKMMVDTPETPANAASEEEEARQAIDMLRGDDVSGRVAAANRLEAVAAALGEERTRDVSLYNVEEYKDESLLCGILQTAHRLPFIHWRDRNCFHF